MIAPTTWFKLFQSCVSYITAAATSSLDPRGHSAGKYRSVFTVDADTRWWKRRVDVVVSYLNAAINVLNLASEAMNLFRAMSGNPGNRTIEIDFVTRSFDLT